MLRTLQLLPICCLRCAATQAGVCGRDLQRRRAATCSRPPVDARSLTVIWAREKGGERLPSKPQCCQQRPISRSKLCLRAATLQGRRLHATTHTHTHVCRRFDGRPFLGSLGVVDRHRSSVHASRHITGPNGFLQTGQQKEKAAGHLNLSPARRPIPGSGESTGGSCDGGAPSYLYPVQRAFNAACQCGEAQRSLAV